MAQQSTLSFSATTGPTRTLVAKTYTPLTPINVLDVVVLQAPFTDSATLQATPTDSVVLHAIPTESVELQLEP